jgi:hypothetical protein
MEARIRARVLALSNVATLRSQVTGLAYRDSWWSTPPSSTGHHGQSGAPAP